MTIKTILIDDNEEYLFALRENLSFIPEVEIIGEASQYKKAKSLLLKNQPDLIFLDIEMPYKNGFELLDEVRNECHKPFKVIFYTAYDQYIIEALRQSAFDYIVKPARPDEIKNAIDRYKETVGVSVPNYAQNPFMSGNNMVALPVNTGLTFMDINSLVYAQCNKENLLEKPVWEITLNNFENLRLRKNITAENLLSITGKDNFLQISQSVMVNKNYLGHIEYKTRHCIMLPPFNKIELTISRHHLNQLKQRFEEL